MHGGQRLFKCFSYLNRKTFGKAKSVIDGCVSCRRDYCKSKYVLVNRKFLDSKLKTMKLESPHFKSCLTEEVEILKNLFSKSGHELRIVGGAVRDLLLGVYPKDLDFATTATPDEMKKIFLDNEIRVINANGEKHGTVTARINDKNLEVTTLRVDMATDGRHAVVQFTQDWLLDANRRDLTINAMYLGFDGTVYDYFNGIEDLKNRRIVFVGNAVDRIKEDYLRILRYFRFYGRVAEFPDNHDVDVLKAIKENAEGLKIISGERIWVELNKILSGNFAGEILQKIVSLEIGPYIGLPENCCTDDLKKLTDKLKMNEVTAKPITLLVSLFRNEDELMEFCKRIKASCIERDLGLFIVENRCYVTHPNSIKFYKSLIIKRKAPLHLKQSFVFELIKYNGDIKLIKELEEWNVPVFPVNGHMLKEKGVPDKNVGAVKNKLTDIWIEHDFEISAEKLLEQIPGDLLLSPSPGKRKRKN